MILTVNECRFVIRIEWVDKLLAKRRADWAFASFRKMRGDGRRDTVDTRLFA